MTFISQLDIPRNRRKFRGRGNVVLTVKAGMSGSASLYISNASGLHGKTVDVQIDEEEKRVRISESERGYKVHKGGTFSASIAVLHRLSKGLDKVKIELILNDDGWWYGDYGIKGKTECDS